MYKIIRPPFGDTPVNFVGVHPVKWHNRPEQPDVAFVEADGDALADATAETVDAIKRAEEAERELQTLRERIANLAVEAALTDGAHHKQWYLERIMVECGAPVQAWHKRHQWAVGIAP